MRARHLLLLLLTALAVFSCWAAIGQPPAATAGFCPYQLPLGPSDYAGGPAVVSGISFDALLVASKPGANASFFDTAEFDGLSATVGQICELRVPVHFGTATPGTCTEPELFWDTDDDTFNACTATDTWTEVTSGSGTALTVEEADGAPSVGSVSTIQFDQADGFSVVDETAGQVQVDFALPVGAVGTAELDDDASTPTAGDLVAVEAGAASFTYLTPDAGTDITADLEEETHAAEHLQGAADPVSAEALASGCGAGATLEGDGAGGVQCGTDDAGTDDQTAPEVPYTPTTPTDWTDPDPTEAGGALDDLAGRLTVEEAKADDDVPEAGDYSNLTGGTAITNSPTGTVNLDTTASPAITGDWDFGGGGIEIENGTTPPACTVGQLFLDTDATSGQQLMACEAGTFVLQGDGGGGGSRIEDADGDTYINVEPTADADFIEFGSAGPATLGYLTFDWDDDGSEDFRIEHPDGGPTSLTAFKSGSRQARLRISNSNTLRVVEIILNEVVFGRFGTSRFEYFDQVASSTDPSYSFTDDTNTGISRAGADDMRLIAGGTSGLGQTATATTLYVAQVNSPSAQTCTDSGDANPGTLIASVSARSYVPVTISDPDGCNITLSETNAKDGQRLELVVVSISGGTGNLADTAGIQETGSGCSMGLHGAATLRYASDRWIKTSCEPTN